MNDKRGKPLMTWWAGGLLLGLTMTLAVAVRKPLGVSTQYVVAEGVALKQVAGDYVDGHPLLSKDKYQKFGYGWFLVVGLFFGAFVASLLAGRFRVSGTCEYARVNGGGLARRMLLSFAGGFLLLLGARMARGCTSGQFLSGWAQLSLAAVPFTVVMFAMAMLTARLTYRRIPGSDGGEA